MLCGRNVFYLMCILAFSIAACGNADQVNFDASEGYAQIEQRLASKDCNLDEVFDFEHFVQVEPGVILHVIEKFSLRSVMRSHHRATLMLPPTFVTNEFFNAQVEGDESYNAMTRMAKAGFFAFSVSYEGYGKSSYPEDGRIVTFERTLDQMGMLIEWIRQARQVRRVDLIGGSFGSSLAISLGGKESPVPKRHVGRIILTSMVYKEFSQLVLDNMFSPGMQEMMESLPYIETAPEMYGLVMTEGEPEAFAWVAATFPGVYATGPTLEGFELPVSDATAGHARALQVWGTHDPVNTPNDVDMFQQEYGGSIELLEIEGGGHSPMLEPGREIFWKRVLKFLKVKKCRKCPKTKDLEILSANPYLRHALVSDLAAAEM